MPRTKRPSLFYHGSESPLEVGVVYRARAIRPNTSASRGMGERVRVEKVFEKFRPAAKPSRLRSFFYASSPEDIERLGAKSSRYVYRVEPLGTLHAGDFQWLWQAGTLDQDRTFGGGRLRIMPGGLTYYDPFAAPTPAREHERLVRSLVAKYWRGTLSPGGRLEWMSPSMRVVERVRKR